MNWVDLVIVLLLIFFALEGFRKSFLLESLNLVSFLISFGLSIRFFNIVASQIKSWFSLPHSLANVLGFIVVWYVVEIILFIAGRVVFPSLKINTESKIEKFLSTIPAFFRGLILMAILLILIGTFPIQPQVKKDVRSSLVGNFILNQTYQLEAPLKNIFGGLANDTLSFLTVKPQTNERIGLGFQNGKFFFDEKTENQMIDLVNLERTNQGQSPLILDSSLRDVARKHSADMFLRGYFSHYSPDNLNIVDRAKEAGVKYSVIGENLAYAPSLGLAHQGLMNSPGHKANILSPDYIHIGIGVANGEDYGLMITQVFKN